MGHGQKSRRVVVARYLLVAIDDNDKAASLHTKLDSWVGFQVVGVFYKATKFCECEDYEGVAHRERKFGVRIHKQCRRPRPESGQSPNNLLYLDVPQQYQDVRINVKEPCMTPAERWTQKVIDIKKRQITENWAKVMRRNRRARTRR
jgi:hypothetical protein